MYYRPSTPASPTCLFESQILADIHVHDRISAFHTQTLSDNWEWKQRPEKGDVEGVLADNVGWTGTSVPTEIFKDLLDAKKIPDPHIDQHEKTVQWVGEVDWLYRTRFRVIHTPESNEKVVLAFDGLDTFASVYLNGKLILQTEVLHPRNEVNNRICFMNIEWMLLLSYDQERTILGLFLNQLYEKDVRKFQRGEIYCVGMVNLQDFMFGRHSIIGDGIGVYTDFIVTDLEAPL
jgi:hypothetical protein